jgi:glycosyltransferase involved in cell wall biosynthesis
MLIGIDGNEANVEKRVGVSVYTVRLLEYFQKQADEDLQFIVYLRSDPRYDLPKQRVHFRYRVVPGPFLWSQLILPTYLHLSRKKPDVFFAPAHYVPRNCPIPTVVTIHDVAYEYYAGEFLAQDLFKLKNWTEYALIRSKKIIAVSKNTKKDIIKFYNTDERKIDVVYNGFSKKS